MSAFYNNSFIRLFFFGNYFYALCAVLLSIESTLQQKQTLHEVSYYILCFSCTLVYYTKASLMSEFSPQLQNVRSQWYVKHKQFLVINQYFFFSLIIFILGSYIIRFRNTLLHITVMEWAFILAFPIIALLYYGLETKRFGRITLRTIAWIKPCVIGFTWAGLVNVYPELYSHLKSDTPFVLRSELVILFAKNFMFITLLSILFDIKDYAMDHNSQLKTIVLKLGLRNTLFYLIIPLCLLASSFFFLYAFNHHDSYLSLLWNTLPFLLMIMFTFSLASRRSIFFYLIIIDGLMLVKALCGIVASLYFE